ncbi:YybH family protein [Shewanella youngdeokensis]|uniref:Nuclear transport factor 2 family protein n=1 Tax=Shewanella youngdeokensis TaxID=2999068 RepID=A0ABZ0K3J5_9GAMM|nr:nuclear transport factor 2 family protein [Shewanella sp. DAU334]
MFKKLLNRVALAVSLILASLQFSFADDNEALNQFYNDFNQAYNTLDAAKLDQLYSENASYISDSQNEAITRGRDNITKLYETFFNKIKVKKARIEVDFRVIERNLNASNATDIGYYIIRYHPSIDVGEPISEFAGKFVMVSHKKDDGKWYVTVDTNNRSKPEFYYDAKPAAKVYYGRQFSVLTQTLTTQNHDKKPK